MQKHYDDYDYEEAYKEQCAKLEEAELERLVKEKKVKCLYRTTTIKSTNKKSGTTILESQVYPSFTDKGDMPTTKRKRESGQAQRNLNEKNARRYLMRLANINFGKGDIWATFGWDEEHYPETFEDAQRDVRNFIKRINYRRKKMGVGNLHYIYIISAGGDTRPHFHILMDGDAMDRDAIEDLWTLCSRKNTRRIAPDDDFLISGLASYIAKQPKEKKTGTAQKRWCPSKNLKKPDAPTRSYSKFKRAKVERMVKDHEELRMQMEKAYPGFRFLDAEVMYNGINAAFYIYARMVRN